MVIKMHEIDLSIYDVHTDLILESVNDNIIKIKKRKKNDILVEEVVLTEEDGKLINKKKGTYITISFDDVTDYENRKQLISVLKSELSSFFKIMDIKNSDKCLIIGLGNSYSTPDSLGPKTVDNIIVTKHLFDMEDVSVDEKYRNVSVFRPGVVAQTGMETQQVVLGIVEKTKPDLLIIIDALASSSIERVNKTIQLTDSGISPGSGVGNQRMELSFETLKVKTLAIGIPTVVDAVTIVSDTIKYLVKKISYQIEKKDNPENKLKPVTLVNYLEDNPFTLDDEERKELLGVLGSLNENEMKSLIFEVLTPIGYNLMVTPKEVDFVIEKLAKVLSISLNETLHKKR